MKNIVSIDIYSDTICPWCYIAKTKLQLAIDEIPNSSFDILWRPFQLNPDMPLEGMNRRNYLDKKFGGRLIFTHFISPPVRVFLDSLTP